MNASCRKSSLVSNSSAPEAICLACGLCCNGVIFADVKLQPGEDAVRLKALGLPLSLSRSTQREGSKRNSASRTAKFRQPCGCYNGGQCSIYADRPKYCRAFECLLLKRVQEGEVRAAKALGSIRTAHKRAEKVRRLLRALGDTNEHVALGNRFRRTVRRLEEVGMDGQAAELFGELTIAFHALNHLLSEVFYPGDLR